MKNTLSIGLAGLTGSNLMKTFISDVKYQVYAYETLLANISKIFAIGDQITVIND